MGLITQEQFEEFEREYLVLVLKNPTYRYGQHFMNTFRDIQMDLNEQDGIVSFELWEERDPVKAREMCLRYVSRN